MKGLEEGKPLKGFRGSVPHGNIFKGNRYNVKQIRGGGGVTNRSFSNRSAASRHDNSDSGSEKFFLRSIGMGKAWSFGVVFF